MGSLFFWLAFRKNQNKTSSLAHFTFYCDCSYVSFQNFLAYSKANACSLVGAPPVQALKGLKNTLGVGNIGPEAALPVMEGKAMLFKESAGIDAFPICLNTSSVDEAVNTVRAIAPGFGGINLEDIAAPHCFMFSRSIQGGFGLLGYTYQ